MELVKTLTGLSTKEECINKKDNAESTSIHNRVKIIVTGTTITI